MVWQACGYCFTLLRSGITGKEVSLRYLGAGDMVLGKPCRGKKEQDRKKKIRFHCDLKKKLKNKTPSGGLEKYWNKCFLLVVSLQMKYHHICAGQPQKREMYYSWQHLGTVRNPKQREEKEDVLGIGTLRFS